MDAHVQQQTDISSRLSGGGEKTQQVKGRFVLLLLLLLGGLGQAAGQGDQIRDSATVTDCTPHTQRCTLQNFPNELMKKTIEEDDTIVMRRQEKDSSARTDKHVHQGLTQSEFAKLLPKVLIAQSTPHTSLGKTSDSQRKWMEETLCADSYEEDVTARKDNFGRFQVPSFYDDVYKVKNLLKLGESVCDVTVEGVSQGTGFVLFDNFILTNAHVLEGHIDEETMQLDVNVRVLFNYDDPLSLTNVYHSSCKKTLIDFDEIEDYAILELNPDSLNFINNNKKVELPPGLLKNFGLVPQSGRAFIIGHPGGGVKKMDPTYIIEKKDRLQVINDHLRPYKDDVFTAHSIIQKITEQGIELILPGGALAEHVLTYKTFMHPGSSGSPVFDSSGRVVGFHNGMFGRTSGDHVIMGYAFPVLDMFKQFVTKLKANGNYKLLRRVEEEARGNIWLELITPPTKYQDDHLFSDDYYSKDEL